MLSRDASGLDPTSRTSGRWRALRDRGVDVMVCVWSSEKSGWSEPGLDVRGSGGSHPLLRLWRLWRMATRIVSSADVVTAQDPFELGVIAYVITRRTSVPWEVQDHGGFFDGEPADEPLWPLRSRVAWFLVRRADRVRTVSPKSVAFLATQGLSARVYWLPIAADMRFAEVIRVPEPRLMVSVGRLVTVKRHDLLLRAFALLQKQEPQARLAILGDGREREALKTLAQELDLAEAVTFAYHDDPAPWLARAELFVLLSSHEGWGVAAVEAAMAGVPVLMTDTGCAAWLAERSCATVLPVSVTPEQVAQAIQREWQRPTSEGRWCTTTTPEDMATAQVEAWQQR